MVAPASAASKPAPPLEDRESERTQSSRTPFSVGDAALRGTLPSMNSKRASSRVAPWGAEAQPPSSSEVAVARSGASCNERSMPAAPSA